MGKRTNLKRPVSIEKMQLANSIWKEDADVVKEQAQVIDTLEKEATTHPKFVLHSTSYVQDDHSTDGEEDFASVHRCQCRV